MPVADSAVFSLNAAVVVRGLLRVVGVSASLTGAVTAQWLEGLRFTRLQIQPASLPDSRPPQEASGVGL